MTWLINVDNGGTTTGFCLIDGGEVRYTKTLTTPYGLSRCLFDGLAKVSELAYGRPRPAALLQSTDCIRYSTSQGTNALVQRAGPQLGLLATDLALVEGLAATTARAQEDQLAALVGDRWGPVGLDAGDEALSRELPARVNDLSARGGQAPGHRGERLGRGGAGEGLYPRHLLGAVPLLFFWELVADPYDIRAPGRACSTRSCTRPLSVPCSTPTGGYGTPGLASRRGSSGGG
jgi:N-methylhydantoinase A